MVCLDPNPPGSTPIKGSNGSETLTFTMNDRGLGGPNGIPNREIVTHGDSVGFWDNPKLTLVQYDSGKGGLITTFVFALSQLYNTKKNNIVVYAMLID
jgi:hypothetical protein